MYTIITSRKFRYGENIDGRKLSIKNKEEVAFSCWPSSQLYGDLDSLVFIFYFFIFIFDFFSEKSIGCRR